MAATEERDGKDGRTDPRGAEHEPADVVDREVGACLRERRRPIVRKVQEGGRPDRPAEREAEREERAADQHELRLGRVAMPWRRL
jgi:hypothetical protein